jgi:hypothetical protein
MPSKELIYQTKSVSFHTRLVFFFFFFFFFFGSRLFLPIELQHPQDLHPTLRFSSLSFLFYGFQYLAKINVYVDLDACIYI